MSPASRSRLARLTRNVDASLLAFLGMAGLALMVMMRPVFIERRAAADPDGDSYSRLVGDLVSEGFIVSRPGETPGEPRVGMTEEALRHPAIKAFHFASNLRTDLAATDDRWRYRDGQLVGIDPRIHGLRDPFAVPQAWKGEVRYGTAGAGAGTEMILVPSAGPALPLQRGPRDIREAAIVDIYSGESDGPVERGFDFVLDIRGERSVVGSLAMVENNPVLSINCRNNLPVRVALISGTLPSSPCASATSVISPSFPLKPGDSVSFASTLGDGEGTLFSISTRATQLSKWDPFAGRRPQTNAISGLAAQISDAMVQLVAAQGEEDGALATADVVLSLDPLLQALLDTSWPEFLDDYRTDTGSPTPVSGAVAMVDALSGEVLALGSQRNEPGRDLRRFRHQALVPMAPGSTAKVPVSAAILAQYPALRFLCAPATRPGGDPPKTFNRVLGIRLESPATDLVLRNELLSFEAFLEQSSNRYAATLLMLASSVPAVATQDRFVAQTDQAAGPLPDGDQYSFSADTGVCTGGAVVTGRPRFRFRYLPGRSDMLWLGGNVPSQLGRDNFLFQLNRLFDMPLLERPSGVAPRNTGVWKSAEANTPGDLRFFADVSPENEDFNAPSLDSLRDEYLRIITGGGEARWTTLKLAHAYGRIVGYGNAPLTMRTPQQSAAQDNSFRQLLEPASRGALLRGMRRVVSDGTAAQLQTLQNDLNARAEEGVRYLVFAKTGTPSIQTPARSPLNALASTMIEARIIRRLGKGRIGIEAMPGETPRQALDRAYRNVFRTRRLSDIEARNVLAWIERTNRQIADGTNRLLQFGEGDRLVLGMDQWRERGEGELSEGGVLAFVVTKSCQVGWSGTPDFGNTQADAWIPDAAIAVAINVDSRENRNGRSGINPGLRYILENNLLGPSSPMLRALNERALRSSRCRTGEG